MNHRAADPASFKIDRVIPMWGIVTLCMAALAQAVLMWNAQLRQADSIDALSKTVVAQSAEITKLTAAVGAKDLKDLEQDFQVRDVVRRVSALEGERRR